MVYNTIDISKGCMVRVFSMDTKIEFNQLKIWRWEFVGKGEILSSMVFHGEIWPIVEVLSTQNSVRRCGLPMNEMMMLIIQSILGIMMMKTMIAIGIVMIVISTLYSKIVLFGSIFIYKTLWLYLHSTLDVNLKVESVNWSFVINIRRYSKISPSWGIFSWKL